MLSQINLLLSKKLKIFWFFLIFFSLIISLLELISLGSLPIFADIIFNEKKLDFYVSEYKFLSFFLLYFSDFNHIVLVSFLLFILFLFKNIVISVYLFLEKYFIYKVRIYNSLKLYDFLIFDNFENHIQKDIYQTNRNFLYEIDSACSVVEHVSIVIRELIVLIALIILLSYHDPEVFFGLFFLLSFSGTVYYLFLRGKIVRLSKRAFDSRTRKIEFLNQTFKGFIDIKIYDLKKYFQSKFIFFLKDTERFKVFVHVITSFTKPIFETISILCIILLILYYFYEEKSSSNLLPALTLLVALAYRMMPLINNLTNSISKIKSKKIVLKEISKQLDFYNSFYAFEFSNKISSDKIITFRKNIELKNVYYTNNISKKIIFNNLNLKILKGEKIFIDGQTGSGKSTLLNILAGLIKLESENFFVDGQKINYNTKNWYNKISYVQQNIYIINDTVEKNICLSDDKINLSKLENLIELCDLENVVKQKKGMKISEDGKVISGGEKQRIGIARALYNDREILILDEATNALDNKTEEKIIRNIINYKKNMTLICVSHNSELKKLFGRSLSVSNQGINE